MKVTYKSCFFSAISRLESGVFLRVLDPDVPETVTLRNLWVIQPDDDKIDRPVFLELVRKDETSAEPGGTTSSS